MDENQPASASASAGTPPQPPAPAASKSRDMKATVPESVATELREIAARFDVPLAELRDAAAVFAFEHVTKERIIDLADWVYQERGKRLRAEL